MTREIKHSQSWSKACHEKSADDIVRVKSPLSDCQGTKRRIKNRNLVLIRRTPTADLSFLFDCAKMCKDYL